MQAWRLESEVQAQAQVELVQVIARAGDVAGAGEAAIHGTAAVDIGGDPA
jgi:hypothetical protein